jgi:hypothetical protein
MADPKPVSGVTVEGEEAPPLFFIHVPVIDLAPCSRCQTWSELTDGDFLLCEACEVIVRQTDDISF